MIYNRGHRADWDGVEQLGNKGWGWNDMLPIFKGFEDNILGASPTRGVGGPVHISIPREPDPLCEEMITAGAAFGLERVEDINESDEPGSDTRPPPFETDAGSARRRRSSSPR